MALTGAVTGVPAMVLTGGPQLAVGGKLYGDAGLGVCVASRLLLVMTQSLSVSVSQPGGERPTPGGKNPAASGPTTTGGFGGTPKKN
jgi:hypothetical protein